MAGAGFAQTVNMKWGLENTWSYVEERRRGYDQNNRPIANSDYRAFAFASRKSEVIEPWSVCIGEIMGLWDRYKKDSAPMPREGVPDVAVRDHFRERLARENPKCVGQLNKTAPSLYFDFTTTTAEKFSLE